MRSRLEKYSMNRYAFVVRGERKGRVVDRVTGADVSDDASDDTLNRDALSAQDKLDLARERIKQAEQEAANARDAELAAAAAAGATSRGGGAGPRESARDVGGSGARRGGEARDAGGERR